MLFQLSRSRKTHSKKFNFGRIFNVFRGSDQVGSLSKLSPQYQGFDGAGIRKVSVCKQLGLSMTTAFNMYAKKVCREKRIPFEIPGAQS